jgi:multidrug efflux pump subunit AcrB
VTSTDDAAARTAETIVLGVVVSLVAALLLAPVMTVSWCSDAPAGGTSVCGSEQRSFAGAASPWWLWLGVQAGIVVATVAIARRRTRAG